MNILIFAKPTEYNTISEIFTKSFEDATCTPITDNEQLLSELKTGTASLLIVAVDGALGMEIAILARNTRPDIPLFWFSDDIHFGAQAYRLNCNYFANKPISETRILTATEKLNLSA